METNEELSQAVQKGDITAVSEILSKGADVESRDKIGFFPLSHAAYKGNKEMMELLIEHGANVNKLNNIGCPPLLYAISYGGNAAAEFLLEKGANINIMMGQMTMVPLPQRIIDTAINDHQYADVMEQRVRFLVEHGAVINEIAIGSIYRTYGKFANDIINFSFR